MQRFRLATLLIAAALVSSACGTVASGPKVPRAVSTVTARLQSDLLTGGPGAMQFANSQVGYVLRPAVNYQVGGGVLERTEDSGDRGKTSSCARAWTT